MIRLISEIRQYPAGRTVLTMVVIVVVSATLYAFAWWVAPTLSQSDAGAIFVVALVLPMSMSAPIFLRSARSSSRY